MTVLLSLFMKNLLLTYKDNAFACKICGKKLNTANHSWVVHTGYTKCSVCGRFKETQADYIHDPRNYLAMN